MVRLKTFGTPVLQRDDGPVGAGAGQRRRIGLLAMLAVAGERGTSRDKIVAYLWPEAGEEQARHTLAQMLYLLRRDFPGAEMVLGASDLRLDREAIRTDVADFRSALAIGDFDAVATLYTGPFLDGFYVPNAPGFERWTETERAGFAAQARAAFERAALDATARRDPNRAAEWWRRVVAIDPLDGRAAVALMQALAAIGDRTGAVHHARRHESLVREELDAAPDPAVTALADQLRSHALAHDLPPHTGPADRRATTSTGAGQDERTLDREPTTASLGDTAPLVEPEAVAIVARHHRWVRATRRGLSAAAALLLLAVLGTRTMLNRLAGATPSVRPILAIGAVRDYTGADTSGISRALTDMLSTNLARVPELRVVSNARVYELIGAGRQPHMGDLAAEISTAARRAGATELVAGAMYRLRPGQLRFDVQRVDLATGAIRKAYSVEGADAFELVDRATSEVVADIGAAPDRVLHVADVTTRSLVAYRLYEEGLRAYYQQNDVPGARRLFLGALREDSSFAMAAFYLAECQRGLAMPSLDQYVRAAQLADSTTDRERLLIRGSAAFYTGEPTVLAIADTLATRYPTEPDGHYLLGEALTARGDFLGAVPQLKRVVAMDSTSLRGMTPRCRACDAFLAMTTAYWLADSLAAAVRVAREWARSQPTVALPWRVLAGMLLMQGRYEEASAAADSGERRSPGTTDPFLDVSMAMRTADFARADSVLRYRLHTRSDDDAAWLLTLSLRYQGRLREALSIARGQDARGPHHARSVPPNISEAIVLFDMGRYRDAANMFAALSARPAYRSAYGGRIARDRVWMLTHEATARAAAGDTAELALLADSIRRLGVLSAYGRDQRLHHYVRGLLLRARGEQTAAADELRRGIFSLTDGYTRNSYELGLTLLALHRPREAIAVLQPALRGSMQASNSYVTHTELHEALAAAFDAAAQPDSAAAHYRYVVRAWARADTPFRARQERARARLAVLAGDDR